MVPDRSAAAHWHHLPDVEWFERVGGELKGKELSAHIDAIMAIILVCLPDQSSAFWPWLICAR